MRVCACVHVYMCVWCVCVCVVCVCDGYLVIMLRCWINCPLGCDRWLVSKHLPNIECSPPPHRPILQRRAALFYWMRGPNQIRKQIMVFTSSPNPLSHPPQKITLVCFFILFYVCIFSFAGFDRWKPLAWVPICIIRSEIQTHQQEHACLDAPWSEFVFLCPFSQGTAQWCRRNWYYVSYLPNTHTHTLRNEMRIVFIKTFLFYTRQV